MKTYIAMTEAELKKLPEYSCSLPTGTTIGKKWKRQVDYHDPLSGWVMGEYYNIGSEARVGIRWTAIKIVQRKWTELEVKG